MARILAKVRLAFAGMKSVNLIFRWAIGNYVYAYFIMLVSRAQGRCHRMDFLEKEGLFLLNSRTAGSRVYHETIIGVTHYRKL